jgi:hypothetical protein
VVIINLRLGGFERIEYIKASAPDQDKTFNPVFRNELKDLRVKDFGILLHEWLNITLENQHGVSLIPLVVAEEKADIAIPFSVSNFCPSKIGLILMTP